MKKFLKLILIFILVINAKSVLAGNITVEKSLPKVSDIKVGDEVLVTVDLKSDGTAYNAVEGTILVNDKFEIEKTITGSSVISIWLENPNNFSGNSINFSGIVPSGYNAESGQIMSIVLKAKSSGAGSISLKNANLFENDGLGTSIRIPEKDLWLNIAGAPANYEPYKISVKDETSPEVFKVSLIREKDLFDGKYALIFRADDKGSGIKEYDITEGKKVFKQVNSPYLLENQRLNEKIYVTAFDFTGNSREVRVVVPNKVCIGIKCFNKYAFIVVCALVIVSLVLWFLKKKKSG